MMSSSSSNSRHAATLTALVCIAGCKQERHQEAVATSQVLTPSRQAAPQPLTVESFALLAGNSVRLQSSSSVVGGHIGAQGTLGPFLTSGFTVSVGPKVKTAVQKLIIGDSVQLGNGAIVGDVETNRLVDLGAIHGSVLSVAPLPPLPGTQRVTPGTAPLTLSGVNTISPGSFASVTVSGTLFLNAGTYAMQSLQINDSTVVHGNGAVKLLVAGKLAVGKSVKLGPAPASNALRIEVSGLDGASGTLGQQPPAAAIGESSTVLAIILAPNGTLSFGSKTLATGAFAARDIDVGTDAKIVWQSGITGACPLSCDDGNPCTTDACGANGACAHVAVTDGFPCDDHDMCTQRDTCQAGACVGSNPVSCESALHCGDAGTCDPQTGTCSGGVSQPPAADGGAPTRSDLRSGDIDQLRLAVMKATQMCRSQIPYPAGQVVTGVVTMAMTEASVPEVMASQLACALDAPPGTTCAALTDCQQGAVVPPTSLPVCAGSDLVMKNSTGEVARVTCSDFGETCFNTDIGALCGVSACLPGETYACDGRTAVACVHGVRSRAPCGRGMICGERNDHLIDCIGAGAACTGPNRCDGTRAVNCVLEAGGTGHEAVVDCGAMGLGCTLNEPTKRAVCMPVAGSCNSTQDTAYCVGGDLYACVQNQWWSVPCSKVSATGRCVPGAGFGGEAACL